MNWHPTPKNACSGVTALSGGVLTAIMGAVPADKLHDWKGPIIVLAVITVIASLVQMLLASHEDRELIKKIETLIANREGTAGPSQQEVQPLAQQSQSASIATPSIDGEVYRLAMSPRSVAWPIVREIFTMKGRPDDAVVDTDILVEMYLVNTDSDKTQYIKEMRLSAEVNGKRVEFKRQDDLLADPFADRDFEYGLKDEQNPSEVEPLKRLFSNMPLVLQPRQPADGWVRFMATEINPDRITEGSITLTVVDSLGNEYSISRVGTDKQRHGEISLRRLAS
jgi:hypothetical protein